MMEKMDPQGRDGQDGEDGHPGHAMEEEVHMDTLDLGMLCQLRLQLQHQQEM